MNSEYDLWDAMHLGRDYEAWVKDFALFRPDGKRFQGPARLRWSSTDGVRILAQTEWAEGLESLYPVASGQVIPLDQYFSLTGIIEDRWDMEADHILEIPKTSLTSGVAEWDIRCHDLRLTTQSLVEGGTNPLVQPFSS